MAVFQYEGMRLDREEITETGVVSAESKEEALTILRRYHLNEIRLRKLRGLRALFVRFSADIL